MDHKKEIQIVSFDNPFPPNYGGVIDVYFKVKALHDLGFSVHLHCYVKHIPEQSEELQKICKSLTFYKRRKNPLLSLHPIPYSIITRKNTLQLVTTLNACDAPILFEGLQTTAILPHIKNNDCFLRLHNNEEAYYLGLSKSEKNPIKKIFYYLESKKYHFYQKSIFDKFITVFTLSRTETDFVSSISKNAVFVPVFHGNNHFKITSGKGSYVLYHGDLNTPDNLAVVNYLITIFKKTPQYELVIASSPVHKNKLSQINNHANINYKVILNFTELQQLLNEAQCNLLLSFQASGTKLKLINALYNSRHCIINNNVSDDPIVKQMCHTITNETDILRFLAKNYYTDYKPNLTDLNLLKDHLSDKKNASIIKNNIWKFN